MGYQKILNPTIKPTQGSVLDWENPLSPNIACWLFNERGGLKAYNLSQKYGIGILDPGVQWIPKGIGNFTGYTTPITVPNQGLRSVFASSGTVVIAFCMNAITSVSRGLIGQNPDSVKWWELYHAATGTGAIEFDIDADTDGDKRVLTTPELNIEGPDSFIVAAVKDDENNQTLLYVNGVVQASSTSTGDASNLGDVTIGVTTQTSTWPGKIFWCYIYDRALSSDEINSLGNTPFSPFLVPSYHYIFDLGSVVSTVDAEIVLNQLNNLTFSELTTIKNFTTTSRSMKIGAEIRSMNIY